LVWFWPYCASRLARNNTDWYTLLDLATVVGVLIADTEGIYDPRDYNARLLLGLRGLLSEAELHTLRLRMDAGRQRQIEQGALSATCADRPGPFGGRQGEQNARPAGAANTRAGLCPF